MNTSHSLAQNGKFLVTHPDNLRKNILSLPFHPSFYRKLCHNFINYFLKLKSEMKHSFDHDIYFFKVLTIDITSFRIRIMWKRLDYFPFSVFHLLYFKEKTCMRNFHSKYWDGSKISGNQVENALTNV